MPGTVRVRLYATAREAVGLPRVETPVGEDGTTLAELGEQLTRQYPRLRPVLRVSRFVINAEYARTLRQRVKAGDEVGVHPPYSGG